MAPDHPAIARGHQDRLNGPSLRQRSEIAGAKSSAREEGAPRSAARRAAPRALTARWDRAPEPRMAGARVVVQRVTKQHRG